MPDCKHGMPASWCGYCNPKPETHRRKPTRRTNATVFGAASIAQDENRGRFVLIRTHGNYHKRLKREGLPWVDANTKHVHIDGFPFLWVIKLILERASNLEQITVIPSFIPKLRSHIRICEERDVKLVSGYYRPDLAWAEGENRSPYFRSQQTFLRQLSGEQKSLFDELLVLGFEAAEITSRYFCLQGEDFITQRQLASEYGMSSNNQYISNLINAVLFYLDPSFPTGKLSRCSADTLRRRVSRLRKIHENGEIRKTLATKLRLSDLPRGLRLAQLHLLEAVVEAKKNGALLRLAEKHPREHGIICRLFGLADGTCATLQVLGDEQRVTRERIRQLKNRGLHLLGIEDDEM